MKPTRLLLVATWFGLVTGLAEAVIMALPRLWSRWIYAGPHIAWMAPVADAALFALPALLLAAVAVLRPRLVTLPRVIFVFAWLSGWSLALLVPGVSPFAGAILAAGIAVQAARSSARHPDRVNASVRRSYPGLATLVAVLAASVYVWQWNGERAALARLPAAAPNVPNVLLIVLDTVTARDLSLHGYGRRTTPNLERLAERGVTFDQAYSTAPWTLPSHGSLFTGRLPHELSGDWTVPLDDSFPTLAEALGARGYATAGFVANRAYASYESGLDRGFGRYEDYVVSPGDFVRSASLVRFIATREVFRRVTGFYQHLGAKPATSINAAFFRWVPSTDRPFFAFLNYFDAHAPYLPPPPFLTRFGPLPAERNPLRIDQWVFTLDTLPDEEIQAERRAYDGAIAYLDDQLRELFEGLSARSLLENTLVIVTSDHGEQFGDHGLLTHGSSLYRSVLHVPLLVWLAGRVPEGVRVSAPVSLRDVPATVMDLVDAGGGALFPGRSLARWWHATGSSTLEAEPVISELTRSPILHRPDRPNSAGGLQSAIGDGVHYIRNSDTREELYDFDADPDDLFNLLPSGEGQRRLERFRAWLLASRRNE